MISTHTFSRNILVNASNCMDIANSNAQNAIAILNQTYTEEIADRNHRVTSFSKALYILEYLTDNRLLGKKAKFLIWKTVVWRQLYGIKPTLLALILHPEHSEFVSVSLERLQ